MWSHCEVDMAGGRPLGKKTFQRKDTAKRPKFRDREVPLLSEEAPIGTYRIDRVVEKLLALGAMPSDRAELTSTMRRGIYFAANMAVIAHRNHYFRQPLMYGKVKRLFSDIADIAML